MHPAIIIGTVRSLWTWLWGRYHVPQNVFLDDDKTDRLTTWSDVHNVFFSDTVTSHTVYMSPTIGLCSASVLSWHPRSNLPDDRETPSQKIYERLDRRPNSYNSPRHLAHPFPKFYRGSKSPKFWFDFRHQSPLTDCRFKTEELIGNLILPPRATMIEIRSNSDTSPTPPTILHLSNISKFSLITALHGMQTWSSDKYSVCLSVKRVICDKTK